MPPYILPYTFVKCTKLKLVYILPHTFVKLVYLLNFYNQTSIVVLITVNTENIK